MPVCSLENEQGPPDTGWAKVKELLHNPARSVTPGRHARNVQYVQTTPACSRATMKNGLYSIHTLWLDGVRGRASGVIILRDGSILGGDAYFWSEGRYRVLDGGNWKGELVTRQHTPYRDQSVRPVFGGGYEVGVGFSGRFDGDAAEVFATSLVGKRSIAFQATLRKIADC